MFGCLISACVGLVGNAPATFEPTHREIVAKVMAVETCFLQDDNACISTEIDGANFGCIVGSSQARRLMDDLDKLVGRKVSLESKFLTMAHQEGARMKGFRQFGGIPISAAVNVQAHQGLNVVIVGKVHC